MDCSLYEHSFCLAFALRTWHVKRTIDSVDRIPFRVRRNDATYISLFHRSMRNWMLLKMTSKRTVSDARWQCYRRNKMVDEIFVRFTCFDSTLSRASARFSLHRLNFVFTLDSRYTFTTLFSKMAVSLTAFHIERNMCCTITEIFSFILFLLCVNKTGMFLNILGLWKISTSFVKELS
jgi:hypothetical protein